MKRKITTFGADGQPSPARLSHIPSLPKIHFQLIVSDNVSYNGDNLGYGFSYLAFGDWGTCSGK